MIVTDPHGAPIVKAPVITGSIMPDPVLTVTKPTSPTGVFSKGTVAIPGAAVSSTVGADRGSANMTVTFPGFVPGVNASVSLGSFGSFPITGETTTIALPESAMTDLSSGLGALQLRIDNMPAGLPVMDVRFGLSVSDINGAPAVEIDDFADVDVSPELDWRFDPPAAPASGVFQPDQSIDLGGGAFHSIISGHRVVQPGSNVTLTWPGYVEGVEASILFNGTRYDVTGPELVIPFEGAVDVVDAALAGGAANPFRLDIAAIPAGTDPSGLAVVVSGRDADGPNTASGSVVGGVHVIPTPGITMTDTPITGVVSKSGTPTVLAPAGITFAWNVGSDVLTTNMTMSGLPAGTSATVTIGTQTHTFPADGPLVLSGDVTTPNGWTKAANFAVEFDLPAGADPAAVSFVLSETTDGYDVSAPGVEVASLTAIPDPVVSIKDTDVTAGLRPGQSTSLAAAKAEVADTVGGATLSGVIQVTGLPAGATLEIVYDGHTYTFPGTAAIPVTVTAAEINAALADPAFVATLTADPAGTDPATVRVVLGDLTDEYGAPEVEAELASITVAPEFHIETGVIKGTPTATVPLCPASGEGGACQTWGEGDSVNGLVLSVPFGSKGLYTAPVCPARVTVTGGAGSPWILTFPAEATGSEVNTLL